MSQEVHLGPLQSPNVGCVAFFVLFIIAMMVLAYGLG